MSSQIANIARPALEGRERAQGSPLRAARREGDVPAARRGGDARAGAQAAEPRRLADVVAAPAHDGPAPDDVRNTQGLNDPMEAAGREPSKPDSAGRDLAGPEAAAARPVATAGLPEAACAASGAAGRPSTVAILMGVYNGSRFLPEQLDTLARQTHRAWTLHASDDGSTDASGAILDGYAAAWGEGRLLRRAGPRQGFAANFLAMVQDPAIEADYVAFCDQDDLWDADKLARAVAWLDAQGPDRPALYASAVRTVDENGRVIGRIDAPRRPPAFGNALVQNVAPGHTMVMNAGQRA